MAPARLQGVIEVRAVVADDWRIWRGLRLAALADAPYAFRTRLADWQGGGDREGRWRARLDIPGRHFVAVLDGRPVGMASGVPADRNGVAELISMWVGPEARGKGVGDELIRAVEGWARAARAGVLRLGVVDGNQAASALYLRNGFRYTGELGDVMADGRHERIMVKALPAEATA